MDFINVGMGAAAGDHTSLRMRSHPSRSEPEGGALAAWAWAGQGVGTGGHLDFPGKGGVKGKWAQNGEGRESEEEGHAFWRVGVFLSFPATLINVVSTSLQLNALERKPRASCCLTNAAKRKLEIKKK